jgi:para-nitrobenzyl esterase
MATLGKSNRSEPMNERGNRALTTVALGLLLAHISTSAAAATVKVAQGRLTGVAQKNSEVWLGVPYAEPPVGELRWRAPIPARSWAGEHQAATAPASCMQIINPPEGRGPWTPEYLIPASGPVSEDCLYLNIWTPKNAIGQRLPVFVWLHGGALVEGSATVPVYDGVNLAANGNVIVVAINYRLGPFGFLVHPELKAEAGTAGNYGHMDQVLALQWIRANIAAFGGDPLNVTIGGQSAGAGSVLSLISSPAARGLFARATAQSGPGVGPRAGPYELAEATGEAFMRAAGASSLAELRRKSADELISVFAANRNAGINFRAVVDGRFLPKESLQAQMYSTDFHDTPILAGYNADENSGYDDAYGAWTQADIDRQIAEFGPVAASAKALYPANGTTDLQQIGYQLARDRPLASLNGWATRRLLNSQSPIFLYNFTHIQPGPKSARYRAFHTGEVPYLFQNLNGPNRTFTAEDQQVMKLVSGYWLNFIRTGNPNGAGLPLWPVFNTTSLQLMQIGATASPARILPQEKIELYEARYKLGGSAPNR